jgi:hypothetical protein
MPVRRNLTVPPARALPPSQRPLALPQQVHPQPAQPQQPHHPYFPPPAALPAGPTTQPSTYGTGPSAPTYGTGPNAPTYGTGPNAPTYGTGPNAPTYGTGAAISATAATPSPTSAVPAAGYDSTYEGISSIYGAPPADTPAEAPPREQKSKRPDECAPLRAEAERLAQVAETASATVAQAAAEAAEAHAQFVAAQRTSDEARRAYDTAIVEANDLAAQLAAVEKVTDPGAQHLQQATTHAAFAAYRRGDISAEQLREVFKRAEGWTPEHDQMSRRVADLRGHEQELARARDAAQVAEAAAAGRAHTTAGLAHALEEQARSAAAEARAKAAAADACEQRRRR